jgi:hypothetical protein
MLTNTSLSAYFSTNSLGSEQLQKMGQKENSSIITSKNLNIQGGKQYDNKGIL